MTGFAPLRTPCPGLLVVHSSASLVSVLAIGCSLLKLRMVCADTTEADLGASDKLTS